MKLLCSVDDAGRDRCTKKRGRMAPVSFSTSAWAEQCRLFALRAATRFAIAWLALFNLRLDAIAECLTTAFNRNRIFRSMNAGHDAWLAGCALSLLMRALLAALAVVATLAAWLAVSAVTLAAVAGIPAVRAGALALALRLALALAGAFGGLATLAAVVARTAIAVAARVLATRALAAFPTLTLRAITVQFGLGRRLEALQ